MDYSQYLPIAIEAARAAGAEILDGFDQNLNFDIKSNPGDWVSEVDRNAENIVRAILEKRTPDFSIIGEEYGGDIENLASRMTWLVDPLDGTNNYLRGMRLSTTLISLVVDGEPVIGVIYDAFNDETYHVVQGQGAFKNNQPIKVSNRPLEKAGLVVELKNTTENFEIFSNILEIADYYRAFYSGGISQAFVADGVLDGAVVQYEGSGPWDFAAGMLLVREAGGVVSGFDGQQDKLLIDNKTKGYIFAPPHVHNFLIETFTNN